MTYYDIVVMNSFCSFIEPWGHLGFHSGPCCPVICVSLFYVIALSFGI